MDEKEDGINAHHVEQNRSAFNLWMQVGEKSPSFPKNPDPNYNANIWNNIKKNPRCKLNANNCTLSESIALMYPLTLPTYSRMGELSLEKFLEESSNLKNCHLKRPPSNHKQVARLKLLSELRNPLQDKKGNILPHKNYKTYPSMKLQPIPNSSLPSPIFSVPRDLFGQKIEQQVKKQTPKGMKCAKRIRPVLTPK